MALSFRLAAGVGRFFGSARMASSAASAVSAAASSSSEHDVDGDGGGNCFFADPALHPTFASLGVESPVLLERVESYLRRTSSGSGSSASSDDAATASAVAAASADVRPSAVQAAAFPAVASGNDVTLGAETGSGKTLAYLLPLMDDVLRRKRASAEENGGAVGYPGYDYARAVILVPNKELVNQVVRMAAELGGGEGRCVVSNAGDPPPPPATSDGAAAGGDVDEADVVRLAVLPGGLSSPSDFRPFRQSLLNDGPPVDIVVATPANLGPMGLSPKNIDLFADVQTLVIDEADMLLDGGYVRQLNDVLMGFRRADKLVAQSDGMDESRDDSDFEVLRTQHVLVAATLPDMGLKSVDAYIRKKFPDADRVATDGMHNARHYGLRDRTVWIEDEDGIGEGGNKVRMEKLVRMLRTSPDEAHAAAAAGGEEEEVGLAGEKVMVFLNTVDDVEGAAAALRREEIDCVPYHAKLGLGERTRNLDRFRRYRARSSLDAFSIGNGESDEEEGGKGAEEEESNDDQSPVPVLVCTDLASRGLDVPSVSAVVQLQFAGNVVAHLHRMGRCGRAGRVDGRGVAFYGSRERELVRVVREAEGGRERMGLEQDVEEEEQQKDGADKDRKKGGDGGGKVGGAFSRRRGFTRKRKKLRREAREAAEREAMGGGGGGD